MKILNGHDIWNIASFSVFFPMSKNDYQSDTNKSAAYNVMLKGGGQRNNYLTSNANTKNTQDLSNQTYLDPTRVNYGKNSGHYKSSSANSRQQYAQHTSDSNGKYKNSNGVQSAYHSQRNNHSNMGSGSKPNSNISNSSSGAPVHPGLGNNNSI